MTTMMTQSVKLRGCWARAGVSWGLLTRAAAPPLFPSQQYMLRFPNFQNSYFPCVSVPLTQARLSKKYLNQQSTNMYISFQNFLTVNFTIPNPFSLVTGTILIICNIDNITRIPFIDIRQWNNSDIKPSYVWKGSHGKSRGTVYCA